MKLGERRANRIRSLFVQNGVDEDKIKIMTSHGESSPLRKTNEKVNRRAEIYFNLVDSFGVCDEN